MTVSDRIKRAIEQEKERERAQQEQQRTSNRFRLQKAIAEEEAHPTQGPMNVWGPQTTVSTNEAAGAGGYVTYADAAKGVTEKLDTATKLMEGYYGRVEQAKRDVERARTKQVQMTTMQQIYFKEAVNDATPAKFDLYMGGAAELEESKNREKAAQEAYDKLVSDPVGQMVLDEYKSAWDDYNSFFGIQEGETYDGSFRVGSGESWDKWKGSIRDESAVEAELEKARSEADAAGRLAVSAKSDLLAAQGTVVPDGVSAPDVAARQRAYDEAVRQEQEARERVQRLEEELGYAQSLKWEELRGKEDFASGSLYETTANGKKKKIDYLTSGPQNGMVYDETGFDDVTYDAINGNQEAKDILFAQKSSMYDMLFGEGNLLSYMTDDEKALYNYIHKTQGADAADEYLKQIKHEPNPYMTKPQSGKELEKYNELLATMGKEKADEYARSLSGSMTARQRADQEAKAREYAKEHPVEASAWSIVSSPAKGLSYLGQAAEYLGNGTIDQNANYNRFSYENTAIRDEVSKKIEASGKWGKAGSFLYQTGMSMGDFLTSAALGGGSDLSLAIMGTGAAADAVISAKDRGLSDRQAFTLGTVAGIAEVFTEKVSLDKLLSAKTWSKGAIGGLLANTIAEGSEEAASDLINWFADVLVAGDQSEWRQAIKSYMDANPQWDEDEAEEKAFIEALKDKAAEIGLDALGGALSGGVMGGVGAISTSVNANRTGAAVRYWDEGTVRGFIDEARQTGAGSDAYKMADTLEKKINAGREITRADVGNLINYTQQEKARLARENEESETGREDTAAPVSAPSEQEQSAGIETEEEIPAAPMTIEERDAAVAERKQALEERTRAFQEAMARGEDVSRVQEELIAEADDIRREEEAIARAEQEEITRRQRAAVTLPTGREIEERRERAGNLRELERSGRESGATEEQIGVARRIADATGRRIVFINEGENAKRGHYTSGTIYVNAAYGNETGQIIAHELTHSIEGSGSYDEFSRLVQRRIMDTGGDLDGMLREIRERYAAAGVELDAKRGDDMKEVVAQYVERELLTSPESIAGLVRENRSLGRRILDALDSLLAKITKREAAKERAFIRRARDLYAQALRDTRSSVDSEAALQQAREALATGEITEDDFDRIYDALGVGLEAEGGGQNSIAAPADRREVAGRLRTMLRSGASVQEIRRYVNSVSDTGARQNSAGTRADGARQILNAAHRSNMSVDEYLRQNWDEYELNGELRPEARRALEMEGGRQYSVKRDTQNRPFVEIDRDILAGVPRSEWVKTVKENLKNKFPNGVTVGNSQIQIDGQSRREMTFSGYMRWLYQNDSSLGANKLRATDNADEILAATTGWTDEGLHHPRKDDIVDFAAGTVLLRVGANDYTARVVVGTRKNGEMLLYDIVNLRETSFTEKRGADAAKSANPSPGTASSTASASTKYIPQRGGDVKTQFSIAAPVEDSTGRALSEGQREYFRDSVVRDEQGNLKVMYHGTSNGGFNIFDGYGKGRFGLFGMGNYFTDSREVAESYQNKGKGENRQVYEVYLNVTNPMDMDAAADVDAWTRAVPEAEDYFRGKTTNEECFRALTEYCMDEEMVKHEAQEMIMEVIEGMGYDGITHVGGGRYGDRSGPRHRVFITFAPEQSKNVTNRAPTESGDIRYSVSQDAVEGQEDAKKPWEIKKNIADDVARREGYPVINGVQIRHGSWVLARDALTDDSGKPILSEETGSPMRHQNYGMVVGMERDGKVQVYFFNKQTDSKTTVAIDPNDLTPVQGTYSPELAEVVERNKYFENEAKIEPPDNAVSEADIREYEERVRTERTQPQSSEDWKPAKAEDLPAKAKTVLQRAESGLVNKAGDLMQVPRFARREYLQEIARKMSREYLENGSVSQDTRDELFEEAYARGVEVDREFYDEYKGLKRRLREMPITISETDQPDVRGYDTFEQFRQAAFGTLRIVKEGATPVDTAYQDLMATYPELFPESITHPADQIVRMFEVGRSIEISERTLNEALGPNAEEYKAWMRNDFDSAVGDMLAELRAVKRYAEDRAAKTEAGGAALTLEEVKELYPKARDARKNYEKVNARNLLTAEDQRQVGRLMRGDIELSDLKAERDNVRGITEVFKAKQAYEQYARQIREWNEARRASLRDEADEYLATANGWKDKKKGILYSRETMERNVRDIVPDQKLADRIVEKYFTPVHKAAAQSTNLKNRMRDRVRALELSRKVAEGNKVSEAHAVQLLGEARDNIEYLQTAKHVRERDGKSLSDWRGVVQELHETNPNMDWNKVDRAIEEFRKIYDELFEMMNDSRVRNGYEPVAYRKGYFPHFQPGEGDGIIALFGKALGISTEVTALPTTINGLTHTFRPGIQWFGNALERTGFDTCYDAVEGFDKYIEGVADVIYQTENIQRLRAFASQARYRTGDEGIRNQIDEIRANESLAEQDKQNRIEQIHEKGRFALSNFVVELEEYTNLLANKKSRADRNLEQALGRNMYNLVKTLEGRVAANMVAVNPGSWLTNFIPLTQGGAMLDRGMLIHGMWDTVKAYKTDDGFVGQSTFLTNRRGSDPLVRTWQQKASAKMSKPMEWIDNFTADSLVRARYRQNVQNRQMSEAAAMEEADAWVAGVMADRSKGSTPTLFNRSNPLTKLFTQFQLEVNNQLSYVCKDMPRGFKEKGLGALALALFKFALGAWLYDEVYEYFIGRRPALDPIGMLNDTVGDLTGYELPNLVSLGVGAVTGDVPSFKTGKSGIGQAGINLAENVAEEMPFVGGLLGGGRLPISSAIPDIGNLWGAATNSGQSGRKRWNTAVKEIGKPLTYLLLPFGGGQMKKILEGVSAVVKGGSYTVDAKGRDIMQYPIYNDSALETAWNVGKASLFGKSSFSGAQRWVDSEFKNYSAKATGAYQGLTQAGVRGRDADDLVIALTGAEKTGEKSKKEVQIELLRSSKIPEDMKLIPYYALMASEKEIELIDELAENGAAGELLDMLISYDEAGMLKEGKSDAQRKAVFDSKLTDREKITAIGILEPSSSYTAFKMQTAQDYGIGMEDYYAAVYGAKDTDGDGKITQPDIIAAIRALNLSNEKKAVLYQLADSGWTPKNNPFATGVGQEVYDLVQEEKARRENSGEEEEDEEKGKIRWEGGRLVLPKW